MALSRWFGQSSSSSGSSSACPPSSNCAKSVKIKHKRFGFENFGNTCYINSVLQALYFCHPFRELIIQAYDRSNPTVPPTIYSSSSPSPSAVSTLSRAKNQRKVSTAEIPRNSDGANPNGNTLPSDPPIPTAPPTMFSALRALFVHISGNSQDKGVVAPKAFVDKLKKENELFRSTMHQDAHEFLIYVLNKVAEDLEEEARNVRSGSSSGEDLSSSVISSGAPTLGTATSRTNSSTRSNIVHDLFEGILTSETRCLTCETVSSRDEAFLDLSIDIEQNSSVTACLRQFSASEMLCHKNKFFCDSCCGLQEAEKRMKIKRLPNVLALHLKRFKYQEDVGKYIKLAYRVAFPLELRLFNTADDAADPDRLYELFAIVVHIGNGPHHGHYVAIVKSGDSWLLFDDDSVDTIKESDIAKYFGDSNNGSAYVLFYQALDLDLPALGLKVDEPASTESAARASPTQAPLLPPGLTHEGDSDASEFAPTTPASPALHTVPTVVPASPPALNVIIPHPDEPASVPEAVTTPTVASPSAKSSGFFNSIRHSPSKPSFSPGSRSTPQETNSPPVPPLPPSIAAPPELASEPSEASTSTTSPIPNGNGNGHVRAKSTMERASGWFARRRSARAVGKEREKPPDNRRPNTARSLQATHDHGNDRVSFTSSSSSSRIPLMTDGSQHSHPSLSSISAPPPLAASATETPTLPPLPPTPSALSVPPSEDNTPTPDSTLPSRLQNGSAVPSPPPSASTPTPTSASTLVPTSTSTPSSTSTTTSRSTQLPHRHHHTFHLTGHKKSYPVLSTSLTSSEINGGILSGIGSGGNGKNSFSRDGHPLKRPLTAGASTSSSQSSTTFSRLDDSPAPPLPSKDELRSPIPPIPRPRTTSTNNNSTTLSKEEQEQKRFSTTTSSTTLKRASRKLSFTSSMLGFVRKDRDKEKEKEKEKGKSRSSSGGGGGGKGENGHDRGHGRNHPPSSFSPTSSLTPGVSINGRL